MKLSKLIEDLNELLKEHGDLEHIYAPSDDEENGYNEVYSPSIRYCCDITRAEDFIPEEWLDEDDDIKQFVKVVML
jgi:hypothetical protein